MKIGASIHLSCQISSYAKLSVSKALVAHSYSLLTYVHFPFQIPVPPICSLIVIDFKVEDVRVTI